MKTTCVREQMFRKTSKSALKEYTEPQAAHTEVK